MNKKELKDEIRFYKDKLDCLENELGMLEKEDETEFKNIIVDINVNADDKDLEEFMVEYIKEEIQEDLEEAIELFNKYREYFDDENDDEHETEINFLPFIDEESGEIVGVIMEEVCSCGEKWIENIFTNGNDKAEELAKTMGYRN